MTIYVAFFLGMFFGTVVSVLGMALCYVVKKADEHERQE